MRIERIKIEPMSFCIFQGENDLKKEGGCPARFIYEEKFHCRLGLGTERKRYQCPFGEEFKTISHEEYSKKKMTEREEYAEFIYPSFDDLFDNDEKVK